MLSKRDARNNTAGTQSQFPYLGLHQAALSGNVGLVQYALSQGQPVDAVWDGISALHAAAAGGSEHVARLLIIDHGADVNFGRQPKNERELKARTASSSSATLEKTTDPVRLPRDGREPRPQRTLSSPSTSTPEALLNPGSTPLHFACAHNHASIARLLLAHGASPHVPDRRSVTPLDLLPPASPDAGPDSIRAVIREYYENEKAKEKEFQKNQGQVRFHGKAAAVLGFPHVDGSPHVSVKRSLENLLSKSPKHIPAPLPTPSPVRRGTNGIGTPTPPPSPRRPSAPASERIPPSPSSPSRFTFGSATSAPATGNTFTSTPPPLPPPPLSSDQRRPSLPHLFDTPSPSPPVPPASSCSRPRSAGSGSQPPPFGLQADTPAPTSGHARPRTKRSLLSLFKKADASGQDAFFGDRDGGSPQGRDRDRGRGGSFSATMGVNWVTGMVPGTSPPQRSPSHARQRSGGTGADSEHEVRTAPPERTTFGINRARAPEDARVPEEVFCDDEEDYGVPLHPVPAEPLIDSDADEEGTMEDERDSDLDLGRTGTADTCVTVRPVPARFGGTEPARFVPPKHAEAWYRDRMEASGSGSGTGFPPAQDDASAPASPRPRPGILRSDHSVRRTASRGALRFEAGQEGRALREKGSKSSLLSIGARSLGSRSRSGSGSTDKDRDSRTRGDSLAVDNRMRGDSVSSASTDASAPARSHVSQDTSTGTMTSVGSVQAPLPVLDGGRYADALLGSSEEEDVGLGLTVRAAPERASGLNIRTVSNHAQAEALVQKTAKEILELTAEPGPNLSAQLAALGETLQLERRFARGEAQRFKSPTRPGFEASEEEEANWRREEEERRQKAREKMAWSQRVMEPYAKDREGAREKKSPEVSHKEKEMGFPLGRTTSLEKEMETGAVQRMPKPRTHRMRRPHTSDSVRSASSGTPRFGQGDAQFSLKLSSGSSATPPTRTERRSPHHVSSHSASLTQSLDYDRPIATPPPSDDADSSRSVSTNPALALNNSAFMSTAALDEFGPARPKRFPALRSLFGKGRQ